VPDTVNTAHIDMDRVIDLVADGTSIRAAGRMLGIPASTIIKRFNEATRS
jgi:transposase